MSGHGAEVPHEAHDPFTKRVALTVAIYAVVLAVAGLGGKNAGKDMIGEQISASNRWAQYQAKSVREFIAENEADKAEAEAAKGGTTAEAAAINEKLRGRLKKKIEKYAADKDEIKKTAEEHEAKRDKAHKKDSYFDIAELLLQISIVLASVAMLAKAHWPWLLSLALVAVALVLTFNGYAMLFHIGFVEGGGH